MGKTESSENCKIVYSLEFSAAKTCGALCRSSAVLCLLAQILTVLVWKQSIEGYPCLAKDYYIDRQNTQLNFFEKISTGGGKKAPQITPLG